MAIGTTTAAATITAAMPVTMNILFLRGGAAVCVTAAGAGRSSADARDCRVGGGCTVGADDPWSGGETRVGGTSTACAPTSGADASGIRAIELYRSRPNSAAVW